MKPAATGITRSAFLGRLGGAGAALFLGRDLRPAPARAASSGLVQRFVSEPDLQPPVITVVRRSSATAPGYLFLAPSSGPGQRGALIMDDRGEPVWFHPTSPETVVNLRAALYRGQPVLTWWEGKTKYGLGVGEHVVFDQSYREIARFPAGDGMGADLHELILTPEGTALVTAWDIPTVDRSSVGGGRGQVIEGIVQELEIPSAKVLFEWRSLDHVELTESYQRVATRFDYFHVNSIDPQDDGTLLVSARNTWTVYKIDRETGKVIWRLGGKKSDFAMGPGTAYAWQHDARGHANGTLVTVFDNADDPQEQPQSRGLAISLDEKRMHATLSQQYVHHPSQLAHMFGSVQLQPNGNVLVGWGATPYFTEYTRAGAVLYDAHLPHAGENYRTLRFPWTGKPTGSPRAAVAGSAVFASWNGATEVTDWQIQTGAKATSLTPHTARPRTGFETMLPLPSAARFAVVVALDAKGKELGRSETIGL